MAFSLVPIALSSSMSGYFIAMRKVYKNAAVQVFGQATKIFLSIYLLGAFFATDTESACLSIIIAGTAAEILSFLIQYYRVSNRR